ncbi:Uncharacterised protein [Turicibacter sanguinis]|nr:Uncharacterised protein [Turicibacter sanguinis]
MTVNVYEVNEQFTVVDDKGLYLGSVIEVDNDLVGSYFKGDFFDFSKNKVLCTFVNDDLINVVLALAQYHQLIIGVEEVSVIK